MTTKFKIDSDEWYPVYTLSNVGHNGEIELTAKEFADYVETMRRFHAWQNRLEKYVKI